jgi:DNA processing protein
MNSGHQFAVFTALQIPGIGQVKDKRLFRDLAAKNDCSEAEVQTEHLMGCQDEKMSTYVRQNLDALSKNWTTVSESGARAITFWESQYPNRLKEILGDRAPSLLFALGNLSLLENKGAGFCGSRRASEKGLQTAGDLAKQLVNNGMLVVSGYAAGVDRVTHETALANQGSTIVVLPEGIQQFRIRTELKSVWDWRRVCVISEFTPNAIWSIQNAMQRNATICGLSAALILIEAKATGGSYAAGELCLKLGVPLFAPVYDGMPAEARGNQLLLGRGARPLLKSRSRNKANVDPLMQVLNIEEAGTEQARLELG